ncbi:hypothetical protein LUTEI9C_100009 [Luteimonas sp. 9C]|nr:hypothetical protein LUTEI9C_100009 [Luteimonas sp. 9C]
MGTPRGSARRLAVEAVQLLARGHAIAVEIGFQQLADASLDVVFAGDPAILIEVEVHERIGGHLFEDRGRQRGAASTRLRVEKLLLADFIATQQTVAVEIVPVEIRTRVRPDLGRCDASVSIGVDAREQAGHVERRLGGRDRRRDHGSHCGRDKPGLHGSSILPKVGAPR